VTIRPRRPTPVRARRWPAHTYRAGPPRNPVDHLGKRVGV